ncbi:hypothetical protein ABTJ37_24200, partial [Acinetobacter baumannii]
LSGFLAGAALGFLALHGFLARLQLSFLAGQLFRLLALLFLAARNFLGVDHRRCRRSFAVRLGCVRLVTLDQHALLL